MGYKLSAYVLFIDKLPCMGIGRELRWELVTENNN